jgi:peroxiredoxin
VPGLEDLNTSHQAFEAAGIELAVVLSLTTDQCRAIIDNMSLSYPLYSDPDWKIFDDYCTGAVLFAPKQAWMGIDADGVVRWTWRAGENGKSRRVPMPLEVLDEVRGALT